MTLVPDRYSIVVMIGSSVLLYGLYLKCSAAVPKRKWITGHFGATYPQGKSAIASGQKATGIGKARNVAVMANKRVCVRVLRGQSAEHSDLRQPPCRGSEAISQVGDSPRGLKAALRCLAKDEVGGCPCAFPSTLTRSLFRSSLLVWLRQWFSPLCVGLPLVLPALAPQVSWFGRVGLCCLAITPPISAVAADGAKKAGFFGGTTKLVVPTVGYLGGRLGAKKNA